jgi:putative transposase
MGRVRAKQRMDAVLRTWLARLVTLGIRLKLLLLARGFYSVRVRQDLLTGEWPFIMPAVKRGKPPTTAGGPPGTSALATEQHSRWTTYTLRSATEGQGDFALAVVCHHTRGQRGRRPREALLYATRGVTHHAWSWIRAPYRRRFGMESSDRQAHQARIRTSSRKPALRLLFMGVALVVRNGWVWLHAEVLAQPQRGARQLRTPARRFTRLLLWLVMEVAKHDRLGRKIPVYHDLYERAPAFGIVFNY